MNFFLFLIFIVQTLPLSYRLGRAEIPAVISFGAVRALEKPLLRHMLYSLWALVLFGPTCKCLTSASSRGSRASLASLPSLALVHGNLPLFYSPVMILRQVVLYRCPNLPPLGGRFSALPLFGAEL